MESFISEKSDLRSELLDAEVPAFSAGEWERRRERFAVERKHCAPVTVNLRVPLQPYGEKPGFFQKLIRRLVRKCIRWYTDELFLQQNEVNRGLLARIDALEARVRELEDERNR